MKFVIVALLFVGACVAVPDYESDYGVNGDYNGEDAQDYNGYYTYDQYEDNYGDQEPAVDPDCETYGGYPGDEVVFGEPYGEVDGGDDTIGWWSKSNWCSNKFSEQAV